MQLGDPITDPLIIKALEGGAKTLAPADAPPPQYSGAILPFSKDAQGNVSFDSNAGIVGSLKRAFTLPSEVVSGQMPILDSATGQANPELLNRSREFAATAGMPMNPAVRAGDLAFPGVAKNLPAPTAQQLKEAGAAGYDAARNSGLEFHAHAVAHAAQQIQSKLEQDGIIAELAPKTFAVLSKAASPAEGATATVANMESIRRSLRNVSGDPTETRAASSAIKGIDEFMGAADPATIVAGTAPAEGAAAVGQILRDARGNYAAAQRSNDLTGTLDRANTGILERAEARAQASNSGRNIDNAIRQRVESLLEKPKDVSGFSNAELDALNGVVQGGPVRNSARSVGNLLGGGGGIAQLLGSALGGGVGAGLGGGYGAAAGAAALPAAGMLAKVLENFLARRSLNKADELVRSRSPLYGEIPRSDPMTVPGLNRATGMGLLSQPQDGQDGLLPTAYQGGRGLLGMFPFR